MSYLFFNCSSKELYLAFMSITGRAHESHFLRTIELQLNYKNPRVGFRTNVNSPGACISSTFLLCKEGFFIGCYGLKGDVH